MSFKKTLAGLFCLGAIVLGSTAGSFLDNPISARSLALGSASAALDESSAAFRNPAAVKLQPGQRYQATQGQVLEEVNYFAFNYGLGRGPLDLGLGFSFLNSGIDGIQAATYDSNGTAAYTGETFSYAGRAFIFTAGMETLDGLFLGANLKAIQETLYDQNTTGTGLDVGLIWQKDKKLTLGLSAINALQPKLSWSEDWTDTLNMKILLGAAYKIFPNWTVYADIEQNGERPLYYGAGTEYILFNMVALRGGANPDQFSLGTGLRWKSFNIDYAYLLSSDKDVGGTHFISIAYLIDNNAEMERLARDERNRKKLQEAIDAEKQRQELEALSKTVSGDEITEEVVTASAEIEPLPVQNQVIMETVTIDISSSASAALDPVEPVMTTINVTTLVTTNILGEQEVVQTTIEPDVSINITEEFREAVSDYRIALMTARYYYQTSRLQSNIYLDNTGNQPIEVRTNFRLLDSGNRVLTENAATAAIGVKGTEVLRIPYSEAMPSGNYYLELNSSSPEISKYQKEQFIKRN